MTSISNSVVNSNPLVSFCMLTYNQEMYVKESVESALSQIYSNLEIIISDDCSTDATFDIIQQVLKNYRGTHKIIINKNDTNLGIGGNSYKALNVLSHGDYIICCAGDDISFPQRTEVLVNKWLLSGKKYKTIFSNAIIIDSSGKEIGKYFSKRPLFSRSIDDFLKDDRPLYKKFLEPSVWVFGGTASYDREVISRFNKINKNVFQEDGVYAFRSLLLGRIYYCDDCLMKYRIHYSSISYKGNYNHVAFLLAHEHYYYLNQLHDAISYGSDKFIKRKLYVLIFYSYIKWIVFSIPILNVYVVKIIKYINRKSK